MPSCSASRPPRTLLASALLASLSLLLPACTAGGRGGGRDASLRPDGAPCVSGEPSCDGTVLTRCTAGTFVPVQDCAPMVCAVGIGCVTCEPNTYRCEENSVYRCDPTGSAWEILETCAGDQLCRASRLGGGCVNACEDAIAQRSNIGCEYWAVDLDNEFYSGFAGENDAAGEQFAVAIANPSGETASIRVELSDAPVGGAPAPREVWRGNVGPFGTVEIPLPQREVDGSVMLRDDGPGTYHSATAYHITSNFPIVAYQFNPIVQSFSNDASLLIPASGLDLHYRVLGWPTANPIEISIPGAPDIEGIPDHSFVTIIGTQAGTTVRVTLGGPIVAGSEIPAAGAGEVITATLGPYEVLNLESDDIPGDLTGTVVESNLPVAVFSGGERGIAPVDTSRIPPPPGGVPEDWCCTDHLEEQVFPTSAWGKDFVITRSPIRSDMAGWAEPDIYRIMADREPTTVTTNLDGADASFTLGPGEWREFYADRSFTLRASAPISIEQILVSQGWMPSWRSGHGGDPSMILFPPYEQYREGYVFLTPTTFTADYVVIAAPTSETVTLDGSFVTLLEESGTCTRERVGEIEGTAFDAITCAVEDGTHRVEAEVPVGIMVYGYYAVGSYGYAGGSELQRINLI